MPSSLLCDSAIHRGVVAGWDARCCETEDWLALQGGYGGGGVSERDAMQPHYHILVDQSDWTYDSLQVPGWGKAVCELGYGRSRGEMFMELTQMCETS